MRGKMNKSSFREAPCYSPRKMNKRGGLLIQVVVQIILIGLIFAIFLMATAGKINDRGVRQQILEKQTALLIDAAVPGMSFEIKKNYPFSGSVGDVEVSGGRVFIVVDGFSSVKGYPYFSRYSVEVDVEDDKFIVRVE